MGKSSAILDASVEALKDATTSNRQQLKSLKDATAKNLDRIASNANVIEALKAGSFKFECKSGWTGDLCELDVNECLKIVSFNCSLFLIGTIVLHLSKKG